MNKVDLWIKAGKIKDFTEGKKVPVKIDPGRKTEVLLCKNEKGWFAFNRYCPHRNLPLDDGIIKGGILECVNHSMKFDLSSGEIIDNGGYPGVRNLKVYPVKIEGDEILVHRHPRTLESWDQGLEF